ncbi:uncharacterized protein PGTG_16580 [Puccinia graminis f. sp. tritici CRL 75-36-700-3]|uniref:DUF6589 domain-containing protein n=1 Tax=Puccinia graminis f. sp. tritici (strain CRL 75-36-700-3 / race SCCL) TaxID=418459 RepID=E3L1X9_PUCGT|nr:uncharacterized protein PGTG_16580 [Puccinia graminis f. sp. tritici CRL 75-36-700-3]EFP90554.1 hypothetical protein PGTG_16580 [Puccinia graminis f. sp. tritici CRL 75-36-700-3]
MIPLERYKELKTQASKVVYVCDVMNLLGMTPKQFFLAFVEQTDVQLTSRRWLWADNAWDSTRILLEAIGTMICSRKPGETNWHEFILSQAKLILKVDKKRENPRGLYFNSTEITSDFFSEENQVLRDKQMMDEEQPFLYKLLKSKILHQSDFKDNNLHDSDSETEDNNDINDHQDTLDEDSRLKAKIDRAHVISKTICSMVTFASNRRKNVMQLENATTFLACGISDRVSKYLNFISLTSSRSTAHLALCTLGDKSEKNIVKHMKIGAATSPNFCPLICIDNLDFQEAVHVKSVDNQSSMFHGTWGYLHRPNPDILASLDPKELSLQAYKHVISKLANDVISPAMFVFNKEESSHNQSVLKSQVANVFMTYIATTEYRTPNIPLNPPQIEVLAAQKPDITMLKLMVASDNSSEGIGEVYEGLVRQSGLTAADFASRLMIIEGDLGTCLNLNSLRAQRKPNNHAEESLSNVFTLLGGAHILWNVAQTIILLHFGNSSDSKDLGCWHFLEALGIKSNQVLNKKDFSLMLVQAQKVHEATLAYLILLTLGKHTESFPKEKISMPAKKILTIIDSVYDQYLSPQALTKSKNVNAPCLHNMLLRLRDFSSIVESTVGRYATLRYLATTLLVHATHR